MPAGSFLGVDLGGSSCKGVLLDASGTVVTGTYVPYLTKRTASGEVTQRPQDWETAVGEAIGSVLAGEPGCNVLGISVTAPAHAVVPVSEQGRALAPVLTAQDARPRLVAEELLGQHGDRIFARTMVPLSSGWTLAQLAWMAVSQPDLVNRTCWVLPVKDYLRFRFTGEVASDPSDATGLALYDPRSGQWDPDMLSLSGFPPACFPPVKPARSDGGGLSRAWARRTGLKAGTPVIVGVTDTAAELLSIGARTAGSGMVKIGSTGTAVGVADNPHPSRGSFTYPHPDPGLWYSVAVTSTAGTAFEWALSVLGAFSTADRTQAYKMAKRVRPGSDGLLFFPYLEGERAPFWLRELRGAFLGLSSAHSTAHICRAVLEGVAMSLKDCYEVLDALGVAPDRPAMTGGGAQSDLWRAILAAVLDKTCRVVSPHGPAIGAAILAAEAVTGRHINVRGHHYQKKPLDTWSQQYQQIFRSYRRMSRELARLCQEESL